MSSSVRHSYTISSYHQHSVTTLINPSQQSLVYFQLYYILKADTYERLNSYQSNKALKLYFSLNNLSFMIAQNFMCILLYFFKDYIVNNYEINCIFETYLKLWSYYREKDCISIFQLKGEIHCLNDNFYNIFFATGI